MLRAIPAIVHDIASLKTEMLNCHPATPEDHWRWMLRTLGVCAETLCHVYRIDRAAQKAGDTASCIANGIIPD